MKIMPGKCFKEIITVVLLVMTCVILADNAGNVELSSLGKNANNWKTKISSCIGVKDGLMQIIAYAGCPMIFSPKINLDAKTNRIILFKMKLESGIDGNAFIHFITDQDKKWNSRKRIQFRAVGTGKAEAYKIDMSKNPHWKGTVIQIRLMPYNLGRNCRFENAGEKYFEIGPGFTGMKPFVWTLDKYGIEFQANSAIIPVPYSDWRKAAFPQKTAKRNLKAQVVFLGDSITQGWTLNPRYENGSKFWKKDFVPMNVQNFALAGDETQNLIWQLTEGKAIDGMKPKLFVVMIGVNNILRGTSVRDTVAGIKAVLKVLRKTHPDAKILLLGLLPNKVAWDKKGMIASKTAQVNNIIKDDADNKHIFYFDSSKAFMDKNGKFDAKLFRDGLHPNEKGYGKWTEILVPEIHILL